MAPHNPVSRGPSSSLPWPPCQVSLSPSPSPSQQQFIFQRNLSGAQGQADFTSRKSKLMAPLPRISLSPVPRPWDRTTQHVNVTSLLEDSIIGYKMKALVWDLYHYTIEPVSLSRLETAVKSLYFIGPPYFNPDQAALILTALTRKYNGNDNPSPWAETVKDSLGVCIKAYLIDWPQREKLDAYELAHIFMFVFGVTFMDLGAPEFQDSLHTNRV